MSPTPELKITHDGHVTLVEICRPPHNFFDFELIQQIAQTFEELDLNPQCRAIVLASEGTAVCAGANFNSSNDKISRPENPGTNPLYFEAIRIFACKKPIVAAIHGPAVGGGLGLALVADFRVTCPEGRFSANFNSTPGLVYRSRCRVWSASSKPICCFSQDDASTARRPWRSAWPICWCPKRMSARKP